jgi:hypothetical protein
MTHTKVDPPRVTFDVHCEVPLDLEGYDCRRAMNRCASWHMVYREFDNVRSAERSARTLCRINRVPATITERTVTAKTFTTRDVATVRTDSYGRVWTDMSWHGATIL